MFSGYYLEGCENLDPECDRYASKLEFTVPQGKVAGVQSKARDAENCGHKTTPLVTLNQVMDEWERYLYESAHDGQHEDLPPEVEARLISWC